MPRSYLGIDQSYSGCAIVTYTPTTGHTGVERFDFSPKTAGTGPQRLAHVHWTLREFFQAQHLTGTVGAVAFEGYAYGAKFKREEMGELGGVLRLALVQTWHPGLLHAVAPPSVKKFVTGSGRADKDKMMLAVYMRWQFEAPNHDVADAYTLARIAAHLDAELQVEPPELKFQQEVLDTVRGTKKSPRPARAAS
ncbi:crossover junction endodeoxyribonuclease RuvC [Streptomyces sp. NPDC086776]|uniref:crossover junction endodeoxyribonuclease RuvC n=1 Tax=Streptomyces sp. NPDC086776 TaxID=3365756 RepID=UPI00381B3D64